MADTRYRVDGLLVDSCAHPHDHGPHQWASSRGGRHCPGHPAPPPEQLGAGRPTASQITDDQLDQLHGQLDTVRADQVRLRLCWASARIRADAERNRAETAELRADLRRRAWDEYDLMKARAERAEQLLTEYVRLADVTHTYGAMGGHDRLGADLTCAGCQLRDRARTALDSREQPGPHSDTPPDAAANAEAEAAWRHGEDHL